MIEEHEAEVVGVVGSPSSSGQITLDIVGDSAQKSLVGSMVVVEQEVSGQIEIALGTVAEVETVNPWHENISMRGVIALHGKLVHLSERADVRGAEVQVQAVYAESGDTLEPTGAALSMSPSTGRNVYRVTDELLERITHREGDSIFYMGEVYRMPGVRLPFNTTDFGGQRGAFHCGIFGPSGVGKTAFTTYYLAGQMRHEDLGVLLIDPQHQFSSDRDLPFPLKAFARKLGREVVQVSLASQLRLPKDGPLMAELLAKTPFFKRELNFRSAQPMEAVVYQTERFFRDYKDKHEKDWTKESARSLLLELVNHFEDTSDRIYKGVDPRKTFVELLGDVRTDPSGPLRSFEIVLSLFAPTNLDGGSRRSMEGLLAQLFERVPGRPRPFVVIDMSAVGLTKDEDVRRALDDDGTKARLLRRLFSDLRRKAEEAFSGGEDLLNTLVVFDEAWRYAPRNSSDAEIKDLSGRLADYARETRKYGLGWMYVLQAIHNLNPDVWEQLSSGFRTVGYGLAGGDRTVLMDYVDGAQSMSLYKSFPQPSEHNRRYPFMVMGAVSPLSFTQAPVFLEVYTEFKRFCAANAHWLPADMASIEDEVASAAPTPSSGSTTDPNDPFFDL